MHCLKYPLSISQKFPNTVKALLREPSRSSEQIYQRVLKIIRHLIYIGRREDMFLLIRNLRYIKTLQSSEVFLLINLNRTTPIKAKHKLMWQSLLNPTWVIIINTLDVFYENDMMPFFFRTLNVLRIDVQHGFKWIS
jgi:hypothetical protein